MYQSWTAVWDAHTTTLTCHLLPWRQLIQIFFSTVASVVYIGTFNSGFIFHSSFFYWLSYSLCDYWSAPEAFRSVFFLEAGRVRKIFKIFLSLHWFRLIFFIQRAGSSILASIMYAFSLSVLTLFFFNGKAFSLWEKIFADMPGPKAKRNYEQGSLQNVPREDHGPHGLGGQYISTTYGHRLVTCLSMKNVDSFQHSPVIDRRSPV